MPILNHLAQAAAVLLLGELLVLLILFAGIAGGLAFGLHWARGKAGTALQKADTGLTTASTYVDKGTTLAATPMIRLHGWFATARETLLALQREARRLRAAPRPPSAPPTPSTSERVTAETTVLPVAATQPEPLTTGTTATERVDH